MIVAPVQRLTAADRPALEAHFLALAPDDRRLRFGAAISDDGIRNYVHGLDFERDGLFAADDDELKLLAVVHVAFSDGFAELGLSVLAGFRRQGLGNALFQRAVTHLRNRGVREVYVHCLTENQAMMHIARKNGMRIVQEGSESEARLELEPASPDTRLSEWLADQQSANLTLLKHNLRFVRALWSYFPSPGSRSVL